nr:NAD-dependent epimerase/dehydratase family protein [uncultured Flavobacterium sp.]
MKIIITGASGFIGKTLNKYLNELHEIIPVSIRYQVQQQLDLNSTGIIHLAGKAHDLKKVNDPQDYYEANFELTKQLYNSFLNSSATVFVFLSSVKASADEVDGVLIEHDQPNPKTHYGKSKLLAENYILNQDLPEGKRVYILRPTMIYGVGNKGNLNLLYRLVDKGLPWPLGAFENQRSFCSIENLCFVINEILKNESIPSGIYNMADDGFISTNQLITLIAKSKNKKEIILRLPKKVILFLAKLGDIFKLPLNTERLKKLTESYVVSNNKIVNAIGKPMPINTEEGLIQTLKTFKKVNI